MPLQISFRLLISDLCPVCAHCGISLLWLTCWPNFTCQFCRQFLWEETGERSNAVHGMYLSIPNKIASEVNVCDFVSYCEIYARFQENIFDCSQLIPSLTLQQTLQQNGSITLSEKNKTKSFLCNKQQTSFIFVKQTL